MIKIISTLLQNEKFNIAEQGDTTILYETGLVNYPEDCVQIEHRPAAGKFVVSEVHRDIKQEKIETEKEDEAGIYAVVLYKRLYDEIVDRTKAIDIRNCLDAGDERKALDSIINRFDTSLFSIDIEDKLKISLIHTENNVDVKFGGEYIAKNATLSRGYVVLYNYCEKLKHICSFYDEVCKKINSTINRETILKMYILGK